MTKPKKKRKLDSAMLYQLLTYCDWAEREGTYYGNKTQFMNRHNEIVWWLKSFGADHD